MSVSTLTDQELSGGKKYTVVRFDTTGTSETFNVADIILKDFSMQCEIPSGIMVAVTVLLEGSISGNNWDTILSLTSLLDLAKIKISSTNPVAYYRIRISAITIGTAPYIDVHVLGVS